MVDIPKISQRSIIAFCDCHDVHDATPVWVEVAVREALNVTALTPVTLRVNGQTTSVIREGQSDADGTSIQGIRIRVVDSAVKVDAYYSSTQGTGVSFGYYDSGSFILSVSTAGDAESGIEGSSVEYTINVLLLGKDWPYANQGFILLRAGSKVSKHYIVPERHAAEWSDIGANTGYSVSAPGGGECVVSQVKVDSDFAQSGLTLRVETEGEGDTIPNVWIYGTAQRPGIYRVVLNATSTVPQAYEQYHPFWGGDGTAIICICIYEPYQPGNVVVTLPQKAATPSKDTVKVKVAPNLGVDGWEEQLVKADFKRFTTTTYDHWSAIVKESNIRDWYFRFCLDNGTWHLYGFMFRNTAVSQLETMTVEEIEELAEVEKYAELATANGRGFHDEQPPKQGWDINGNIPLAVCGDSSYYIPPDVDAANGGWYDYAGDIDGKQVYERHIHYVQAPSGWNYGGSIGLGIRYLAYISGKWRISTSPNMVVTSETNAPAKTRQGVCVPFCPGKKGDFGSLIPANGGDAFHSLANQFANTDILRVVMDEIAGAQWEYYPMRRLLSLFKTGATLTISLEITDEAKTEMYGTDMMDYWGPLNDDFPSGEPSVSDLQTATDRQILVGQKENHETLSFGTRSVGSASIELPLSYAVWNTQRLLTELCNITSSGTLSGNLERFYKQSVEHSTEHKIYKLCRPEDDPPYDTDDYAYEWHLTGGEGFGTQTLQRVNSNTGEFFNQTVADTFSVPSNDVIHGEGTITWQRNGSSGSYPHPLPITLPSYIINTGSASGHPSGYLEVTAICPGVEGHGETSAFRQVSLIPGATTCTTSLSGTSSYNDGYGTTDTVTWNGAFTATVTQIAKTPWPWIDPGPAYDNLIGWQVFAAEEAVANSSMIGEWSVDVSTISGGTIQGKGRMFVGEGRDSDDPHRCITLAAAADINFGGTIEIPSGNTTLETTIEQTSQDERRNRDNPEADWVYTGRTPDGEAVTEDTWEEVYTSTQSETVPYDTTAQAIGGQHGTATGLAKYLLTTLIAAGGSVQGRAFDRYMVGSANGEYTVMETSESGTSYNYNKTGTLSSGYSSASCLPTSDTEVVIVGDDPRDMSLERTAPADQHVENAWGRLTLTEHIMRFNFQVNVTTQAD